MKIGMIFPGFGRQYVGMGKDLYDTSRIVQEYFEEASNCLDENFVKLCFASSDAEITKMHNAYPALFLVSVAIAAHLKDLGIVPDAVAGFNTGEFAALCAAHGLTFPDGLYILKKLSQFYQEEFENKDMIVSTVQGVPRDLLDEACTAVSTEDESVAVAFYKSEKENIVSGHFTAFEKLKEYFVGRGVVTYKDISDCFGLHSSLMNNVVEQLRVYLAKVDFKDSSLPLLSSFSGKALIKGEDSKEELISQLSNPLACDKLGKEFEEYDLLIEVGSGSELGDYIKACYPDKKFVTIQKQADVEQLLSMVKEQETTNEEVAVSENEAIEVKNSEQHDDTGENKEITETSE